MKCINLMAYNDLVNDVSTAKDLVLTVNRSISFLQITNKSKCKGWTGTPGSRNCFTLLFPFIYFRR